MASIKLGKVTTRLLYAGANHHSSSPRVMDGSMDSISFDNSFKQVVIFRSHKCPRHLRKYICSNLNICLHLKRCGFTDMGFSDHWNTNGTIATNAFSFSWKSCMS
uniref:Ovule protein n=1 Tax=Echinococcus granulosus TaxID=6210 RepID=A0A068WYL5_ECHGR|nr:hypothetical protein EgrG_002005400 [Echinococcus granulosus]